MATRDGLVGRRESGDCARLLEEYRVLILAVRLCLWLCETCRERGSLIGERPYYLSAGG